MLGDMKQFTTLFGGVAGLVVASLVGLTLFTLLGGLILVAGVVLTALAIGGGVFALVTGRRFFKTGQMPFGEVRIFDLRTGEIRPTREGPRESDMIDVTPPKAPGARSRRREP